MSYPFKTVLAIFLALTLCLGMVPAAWAGDFEESWDEEYYEEGSYDLDIIDQEYFDGDFYYEEQDGEEEEVTDERIFVCFLPEPSDAQITVYDPWQLDDWGFPVVFFPEEDGTYLLLPGEYRVDVECEGYEPFLDVPLIVGEEAMELPVVMTLKRVAVAFTFEAAPLSVTVYDPTGTDEYGEPAVIEPEEDGSYLLVPGEYLYDASADGFEPVEAEPVKVYAEEALEIPVFLTALPEEPSDDAADLTDDDDVDLTGGDDADLTDGDNVDLPDGDDVDVTDGDDVDVTDGDDADLAAEDDAGAPAEDDDNEPTEDDADVPVEDDADVPVEDDADVPVEDDADVPVE